MDKDMKGMLVFFVTVLTVAGGGLWWFQNSHNVAANDFRVQLEDLGYEVKDGIIDSPSVIIPLNKEEFLEKVSEIARESSIQPLASSITIFYYSWCFYVFEPNMQITYRYTVL